MRRTGTWPVIALMAGLLLVAPPAPVDAGILDSIKGFFGKMFGGGSRASETGGGMDGALGQVESSQQDLAQKQQALTEYYNSSSATLSPTDSELKSRLDAMDQSSRNNEQLYLQFLNLQSSLKQKGQDMKDYQERFSKIASTQEQLETNYQKIQEANRKAGFYEPPAGDGEEPRGSLLASSGGARGPGATPWLDPEIQGYMDEWRSMLGLNKWGQWEGNTGSTVIRSTGSAGPPGMMPHEVLWMVTGNSRQFGNMTLEEYVRARLRGEVPDLKPRHPGGGGVIPPASETRPVATIASSQTRASSTQAGVPTDGATELATIDAKLREGRSELEGLAARGRGNSAKAQELLGRLQDLEARLKTMREELTVR